MTFEGQYLTYAEFQALGGSAIGEMPFNLLEFESRKQIDTRTFNRIKALNGADIPQEVKICEYNLINSINGYVSSTNGISNKGNIKSENTDGYSVQYISASDIADVVNSKNVEINNIIDTYLFGLIINGQHILYNGI